MSIHSSLRGAGSGARHRNVLTRIERIEKLRDQGKWTEEDGDVFGLPKVRTMKIKVGGKKKKKKAEDEAEAAPAATPAS